MDETPEARVAELETAVAAASAERETLTARVSELEGQVQAGEARLRDSVRTGALALALQRAGCRDVDAALRLLDAGALAVDADGTVHGIPEAVEALRQERAYLFTPRGAGGAANPGAGTPGDPAAAFAAWLRGS
jgi:hypothetical protein